MVLLHYLYDTAYEMCKKRIKVTEESMTQYLKDTIEDGDFETDWEDLVDRFGEDFVKDMIEEANKLDYDEEYNKAVKEAEEINSVISQLERDKCLITFTTVLTGYLNNYPRDQEDERLMVDTREMVGIVVDEYDKKQENPIPSRLREYLLEDGIKLSSDLKEVTYDALLQMTKQGGIYENFCGAFGGETAVNHAIEVVATQGKYYFDNVRLAASKCSVEVSDVAFDLYRSGKEVTLKLVLATLAYKKPDLIKKYDEQMIGYAIARALDQVATMKEFKEYEENLHKEEK